ncbi:MAG: hypothetical protein P8Y97_21255 [Candidatus Lokiarchaeota archaeon]
MKTKTKQWISYYSGGFCWTTEVDVHDYAYFKYLYEKIKLFCLFYKII